MRHSNVFEEIGRRHSSRRNARIMRWVCIVGGLCLFALAMVWYAAASAMAQSDWAAQVHLCVGSVRGINRVDSLSTLNPQDCVHNPYYVN